MMRYMLLLIFLALPAAAHAQCTPPGGVPRSWNGTAFVPTTFCLGVADLNAALATKLGTDADISRGFVTSNAALKGLPLAAVLLGESRLRAGFSTAGDGGAALYAFSPSNCVTPDNGAQVQPTTGNGCWIANFALSQPTPKVWGAIGDGTTDDSAAVQAAITAMANKTLWNGPWVYQVNTGVTSSAPIYIVGSGGGAGIYDGVCKAGFRAGTPNIKVLTLSGPGSTVDNTCIDTASGVTNASGAGISIGGGVNGVKITRNQFNGMCFGVDVTGVGSNQNIGARLEDNTFRHSNNIACSSIRVGALSTAGNTGDTRITNNIITCNNNAIGMLILDAGGMFVSGNETYACSYGTKVVPGANQEVSWGFWENTIMGDTSATSDLLIDTGASSALVRGLQFTGTWASNAVAGPSVVVQNSGGGTVAGVHFVSHRTIMQGNNAGFDIKAGSRVTIDNSTICTSNPTSTGKAVIVEGTAVSPAVRNSTLGYCDNPNGAGTMAVGLAISSAGPNVGIFTGIDFSSTVTPVQFTPATGNASYATMGPNYFLDTNLAAVASGSSVALPVNTQIHITGSTAISGLTGAWQGRRAILTTVDGPVSFTTGGAAGNGICTAFTSVQYVQIAATYNGGLGCWQLK